MKAIWQGVLSFGLLNMPIRMHTAVKHKSLKFHFLHKEDLAPVHYAKVCREDGEILTQKDIVRGYEYKKGSYVIMSDQDFKRANLKETHSIQILHFADMDEIDARYFEKPYYLTPDKGAERAYTLLRDALKKAQKVGIVKFVLRRREHLGLIKVENDAIILEQLRFRSELETPQALRIPKESMATPREHEIALELIRQLTADFEPGQYHNTYEKELKRIIAEKAEGQKPKTKGKKPEPTKVEDLFLALKQSLEQEKA